MFLTVPTPAFTNGGRVGDAMWYGNNNTTRATVAGRHLAKGLSERRDYLLRLIQAHPKVLGVLTGDEHHYNKTRRDAKVRIYRLSWDKPKVELKRPFWQINNGDAVIRAGQDAVVGGGERVLDAARRLPADSRGPPRAPQDRESRDARGCRSRGAAQAHVTEVWRVDGALASGFAS